MTERPSAEPRPQGLRICIVGPIASQDIRHLLHAGQPPLPAGYAGAPIMATLIQGLIEAGHSVTAITLSSDLPLQVCTPVLARGPNLVVEFCPMRRRAWRFNGWRTGRIVDLYAFERRSLRLAIERAQADVVHAHWAYEFAWAALRSGRPHLVTSHDSPFTIARFYRGFTHGGYRWLRALMAWHVLRHARRVSTVSPYMLDEVQPLCRVPVDVVPNPVPPAVFAVRARPDADRRRVLMICNGWGARKNPEPALRAFAALSRRLPEAELVLLGHGFGLGEEAERWWLEQGLQGRVRFVGGVPYAQVLEWIADSDMLLHPSLEESFGAVLAEAMAVGTPVIAGRSSGAVPWVVGDAGRLVDVTSADAMADAMHELFADTELRLSIGAAACASIARRFASASVVAQYESLYRQVLAASCAAAGSTSAVASASARAAAGMPAARKS